MTPLWVDAITAVLVVWGALTALVGSFGVLRLKTFFQRIHAPSMLPTMATWCFTLAAILQVSYVYGLLYVHAILITVFLAITVPVTTVILMRAALFRARERGEDVPLPPRREEPPAPA